MLGDQQIKRLMNEGNHVLRLKREQSLKELTIYIENISKYEQNNSYLKKLIKKSKKRHKKAIKTMFKTPK